MNEAQVNRIRSIGIINIILGAWLIISPFLLNYSTTAAYWNEIVTAAIVIVLALIRVSAVRAVWASWLNGIAGIWLIISPFIFSYAKTAAYWNAIIFGIIIAILAFSNASSDTRPSSHAAQ